MAEAYSSDDQLDLPLRNRIVRSRVPAAVGKESHDTTDGRSRRQQNWASNAKLELALKEIDGTGKSVRRVALEYGIPKSTLHDYARGKILLGAHQGPDRYLTEAEEDALKSFVLECADVGYPKTVNQILGHAQAMIEQKEERPRHLLDGGKDLSEDIQISHLERRKVCPKPATSHKVLHKYFDKLQETLTMNGLLNNPGQIFNCDESGFPLDHKTGKIVTRL